MPKMNKFSMKQAIKQMVTQTGYQIVPRGTIPMDVRQMRHFLLLAELMGKVRDVSGAVVECGVGRGRSFLQFSYLIATQAEQRILWGFDSFEGFPDPAVEDASARNPKKGEWSGTSPDSIREVLRVAGIGKDFIEKQARLVPGFFTKSLSQYDGKPIALLHVDADLYESYRDVLTALVPHVSPNGIVLFDEYGHDKWPGATKAVDEFLKGTPWKLEYHKEGDRWYFIKTAQ